MSLAVLKLPTSLSRLLPMFLSISWNFTTKTSYHSCSLYFRYTSSLDLNIQHLGYSSCHCHCPFPWLAPKPSPLRSKVFILDLSPPWSWRMELGPRNKLFTSALFFFSWCCDQITDKKQHRREGLFWLTVFWEWFQHEEACTHRRMRWLVNCIHG